MVNNDHHIIKFGIVPLTFSDHYLVYSILKASVIKTEPRILKYRSYKSFNVSRLNYNLQNVAWHIVENESNINDALFYFPRLLTNILQLKDK